MPHLSPPPPPNPLDIDRSIILLYEEAESLFLIQSAILVDSIKFIDLLWMPPVTVFGFAL